MQSFADIAHSPPQPWLWPMFSHAIGASWGQSRLMKNTVGEIELAIACPRQNLAHALTQGINRILAMLPGGDFSVVEEVMAEILGVWEQSSASAVLAQAARRRKIPVTWPDPEQTWLLLGQGVRGHIYQHGYLSGTGGFRDLADDKLASARWLEKAGLPTTRPIPVATAREAVAHAIRIGMPVVLKPNHGWAQVGVWTNLRSPEEVRRAFRRATQQAGALAGPLLIERQREGKYLRATLVAGKLKAVLTCESPTVTGDGRRSAEALAKEFYHLPARGKLNARSRGILEAV
jgi:cyanophycin synthetase